MSRKESIITRALRTHSTELSGIDVIVTHYATKKLKIKHRQGTEDKTQARN